MKTSAVSIDDTVLGSAKECFFSLFFVSYITKKEMLNYITVQLVKTKRQFFSSSWIPQGVSGPLLDGFPEDRPVPIPPPPELGATRHVMACQGGAADMGEAAGHLQLLSGSMLPTSTQEGSEGSRMGPELWEARGLYELLSSSIPP